MARLHFHQKFSSKIFIKINQMLQFPIQSWIAIF